MAGASTVRCAIRMVNGRARRAGSTGASLRTFRLPSNRRNHVFAVEISGVETVSAFDAATGLNELPLS